MWVTYITPIVVRGRLYIPTHETVKVFTSSKLLKQQDEARKAVYIERPSKMCIPVKSSVGQLVGWSMDSRMTQTLVMAALTAAYLKKKPKLGLLHRSDCGGQYCSAAYCALQASNAMQMSMSRKGNGW